MKLSLTHYVCLILALALTIVPGIIAARRVKSADDYSVGGRSSNAFMVAGSIIATVIGGAATVGTAQMGFKMGMLAWWFTLGSGISFILMALFYAASLRKSGLTTVGEFLVVNFGKPAGWLASLSSCAGIFFSIVASTLTALHVISMVFNVSLPVSGAIILFITAALVFLGGINGSALSGLLKLGLIFATIFVGGFLSYEEMGALEGIRATFPALPWLSVFGRGVGDGLTNLATMIVGVISTQSYIQAIFSAKDARTAAVGCIGAALVVIPVGLPSVLIGMFMHLHHPEINSIDALPLYLATYLPDWLGGMGLAAVLISALNGIAGLALGVGTMLSRDIVSKFMANASAKALLWSNRFCVLFVTLAAIVFVFFHLDSTVLSWNYLSMALRGSGIFLPLTFCIFFHNKINRKMGLLAMGAGIFAALFWNQLAPWKINGLFLALVCNLVFLLIGLYLGKENE